MSSLIVATKGSVFQFFETGTTSVWPENIIGFLLPGFLDFKVAKRLTLFFSSSNVLKDVAPFFFNISSQ